MKTITVIVDAALSLLAVGLMSGTATGQEPPRLEDKPIPELVRMLGSPSFAEREAAQHILMTRDDAVPALRRALKSGNAEIARRGKSILSEFDRRSLPRYLEYGRKGRVDVLVEWVATAPSEIDEEAYWQCVIDIALGIRERSKLPFEKFKPPVPSFPESYRSWLSELRYLRNDRLDYRVRPEDIAAREGIPGGQIFVSRGQAQVNANVFLKYSMITAAGAVKMGGMLLGIVFTNDDVSMPHLNQSVVVCDGDADCKRIYASIVISRQGIVARAVGVPATTSHLHAGQHVRVVSVDDRGKPVKASTNDVMSGTEIAEGQRTMLGVRFFETADVGVEVSAIKGGIKVAKLSEGLPPAKAGIRVDDLILTVDGKKSADVETFRRQLRRAFVQDQATISVLRGDKTIELMVDFYGFDLLKGK